MKIETPIVSKATAQRDGALQNSQRHAGNPRVLPRFDQVAEELTCQAEMTAEMEFVPGTEIDQQRPRNFDRISLDCLTNGQRLFRAHFRHIRFARGAARHCGFHAPPWPEHGSGCVRVIDQRFL